MLTRESRLRMRVKLRSLSIIIRNVIFCLNIGLAVAEPAGPAPMPLWISGACIWYPAQKQPFCKKSDLSYTCMQHHAC